MGVRAAAFADFDMETMERFHWPSGMTHICSSRVGRVARRVWVHSIYPFTFRRLES